MYTVSVIVITYKRLEELRATMESLLAERDSFDELLLIDNCSGDETESYGRKLEAQEEKVRFFEMEKNLGVAGGRNFGMRQAAGDVMIFLDDDAVFEKKGMIAAVRAKMEENPKAGVLAFRVINFYTGQMRTEEIPFTDKGLDMTKPRLTSAYIGAGHAIRKEVTEICGLYPEDYFYGGEELDLSFRIVNAGYEIQYEPSVAVLHKQVPGGRVTNREKWIMVYRNRMLTAYRYLPALYEYVSDTIWFLKIIIKSRNIAVPFEAIKRFRKAKKETRRTVVSREALRYLKANYGRLWM